MTLLRSVKTGASLPEPHGTSRIVPPVGNVLNSLAMAICSARVTTLPMIYLRDRGRPGPFKEESSYCCATSASSYLSLYWSFTRLSKLMYSIHSACQRVRSQAPSARAGHSTLWALPENRIIQTPDRRCLAFYRVIFVYDSSHS